MSAIPVNDWSVQATLTVDAETEAAATAAVTAALSAIKTALAALTTGVSYSVPEAHADEGDEVDTPGTFEFDYDDAVNGGFYLEGALLVPSVAQAQAQSNAEAAFAAISSAISSLSPTTTVVPEIGEEGGYVFNLLQ